MGLDQYLITNSKAMSMAINKVDEEAPEYGANWVKYRAETGIVAEWRKANQIHKWFVHNVQDSKDDCGYYEVEPEQLEELLEAVNEVLGSTKLVKGWIRCGYTYDHNMNKVYNTREGMVLEDSSTARRLLPTQEGFFFGGTAYDQYYWEDLESTKAQLEAILETVEENEERWGWQFKGDDGWLLRLQYHSSW